MSVEKINYDVCIGCGQCVDACIMDVLRFDDEEGKPIIKYPKDCYCCYNCAMDCPVDAIFVNPLRLRHITPAWS